jgi:chorismate mutase/prephenate dehydratase
MDKKKIAGYQGVEGSFSYEALKGYLAETGTDMETKALLEFEDVFALLEKGKIDMGIVPVENSSTGSISVVYDLMKKYNVFIAGEIFLKVSHNLLVRKGTLPEDIEEVYSHQQAFDQSSDYFREKPWKLIPYKNTALSAKYVAELESGRCAAVASSLAADLYGMEVLDAAINNNAHNYTRFLILSNDLKLREENNKTSFMSIIDHEPGSLYKMMSCFADYGINMMKIESRPIANRPWEYAFYIDFEGNMAEERIKSALEHIKRYSREFKVLGNYPKGAF